MAHPRQQIRKAVAAALAFKTAADDRVFTSRVVPWKTTDLPGLAIYTPDETVDGDAQRENSEATLRALDVDVRVVVSVSDGLDDELDERALEVETAVRAAQDFGIPEITSVRLKETNTGIADEQGRAVGVVRLNYEVRYASTL
jgi:hypothetical protein